MRNKLYKAIIVNCANSYFSKLSSANKREEQSDERFKPTTFERRWDMNVSPHKEVVHFKSKTIKIFYPTNNNP